MIEGMYGGNHSQLMYGVFTTPVNSISGSAVCAFSLKDINKAFESSFKEQAEMNANWLPVPPNKVRGVVREMSGKYVGVSRNLES